MYEVQNICGELQKQNSEERETGSAPSCTLCQQESNACLGAGESGVGWSVIVKDKKNIGGKGYMEQNNRNRENMTKAQTSAHKKLSRRVLSLPVWQKKYTEGKKG